MVSLQERPWRFRSSHENLIHQLHNLCPPLAPHTKQITSLEIAPREGAEKIYTSISQKKKLNNINKQINKKQLLSSTSPPSKVEGGEAAIIGEGNQLARSHASKQGQSKGKS